MARLIDEEPTDQDLDEVEMTRDELVERFEQARPVKVARTRNVIVKNTIDGDAARSVVISGKANVRVFRSSRSRSGVSLPR